MTVRIKEETIRRKASKGQAGEGTEYVDLKQVKIQFIPVPKNAAELKAIDRTGDNGRFVTAALLIAAYKTWTPQNEDTCAEMMKALMNSPVSPDTFTNHTKQFVKDRMLQNGKWQCIADAYCDGATPENNYRPSSPVTITLREYPYLPQKSTMTGKELLVEKIVSDFAGADTERSVSVYKDPTDGRWYLFSDSCRNLLGDIKGI